MHQLLDLLQTLADWPVLPARPPGKKRVFSPGFVALAIVVVVVELTLLNAWTGHIS